MCIVVAKIGEAICLVLLVLNRHLAACFSRVNDEKFIGVVLNLWEKGCLTDYSRPPSRKLF